MKIKSAEFVKSAVRASQYPRDGLPEVALVGRSNVGKSSLINTLVGMRRLAKTSSTPGKTQTINFYRINKAFYLVDLPGYGYARTPAAVRKSWEPMIERYFKGRAGLRGIIVILDARREVTRNEQELYGWLAEHPCPVITVVTKADKLSGNKLFKRTAEIKKHLSIEDPVVFSALTGLGKAAVGKRIRDLVKDS